MYVYVGNNPVNRIDPWGLWYVDVNFNIGFGFFGPTVGGLFTSTGLNLYAGGGPMTPGSGVSLTWSPDDVSTGWNYGLQGASPLGPIPLGPTIQEGYDSAGAPFAELGVSTPGASATAYYVFDEFVSWKTLGDAWDKVCD